MEPNNQNLKDTVLRKIRTEKILMRPKLYFTLQVAALVVVAFCVLVLSIFIFNFLFFTLRINSHEALLGFGPRGIEAFLIFFPWELLALDVLLVLILQWMLRTFRFGYRIPALYLIGGLLGLSAAFGVTIDRGTLFNDFFLDEADNHQLPWPIGEFYGHARRPPLGAGICKCTITAIARNTITVQDSHSTTTLTVVLPDNDDRATTTGLAVGDTVLVAGDRDGNTIEAFGVRKVPSDWKSRRMK